MKIKKLNKKAVRQTSNIENVVHLSDEELKTVVGGDGGPAISSENCAIHFYYPADSIS